MPVIYGDPYSRDLANAKVTFSARVRRFAHDLVPGVNVDVIYSGLGVKNEAEAFFYPKRMVLEFVVDDMWIEANMYNLDSEATVAAIPHELCHLKLEMEDYISGDPKWDQKTHHMTKPFINCLESAGVSRRFAGSKIHEGRNSFRHYLGSKGGNVPTDIFFIYELECQTCLDKFYINALEFFRPPRVTYIYDASFIAKEMRCNRCAATILGGGHVEARHLMPMDVYREGVSDALIVYG